MSHNLQGKVRSETVCQQKRGGLSTWLKEEKNERRTNERDLVDLALVGEFRGDLVAVLGRIESHSRRKKSVNVSRGV